MKKQEKIGVIGAGAWGTALALRLAQNHDIILWAHEKETVQAINQSRENRLFLPKITLPENIRATQDFADLSTLAPSPILFFAPPAQFLRPIARAIKPHISPSAIAVICSKGIETQRDGQESGALMSDVLAEELPQAQLAVLSGPSFAAETAQGLPLALTLAAPEALAQNLLKTFSTPDFRLYPTSDLIGTQIGGAVKNVLAIACGIAEGRQLGQNVRAALLARGLAETLALAQKLGGQSQTLMGLSGIGDIVLTCTSTTSRNFSLGVALGKGESLDEIMRTRNSVSEGVHTAASLHRLAQKHGLMMPICFAVHYILAILASPKNTQKDIHNAINSLLEGDISQKENT